MKSVPALVAALAVCLSISACVAPVGPVEVTRFHLPGSPLLQTGTIAVEPAIDGDAISLEFQTYAAAVTNELRRLGYGELVAGSRRSDQVALVSVQRTFLAPGRSGSPVSVGVGGGTGGYGSGVGVGVGLNLSGPPPEMVETRLAVTIRDRASGQALWEGRATFTARASSPQAQTQIGAANLAQALFKDFPGTSGETIFVE